MAARAKRSQVQHTGHEVYVRTQSQLAWVFDRSIQWVQKWLPNGAPPKVGRRGYPLGGWIRFVRAREQPEPQVGADGVPLEPHRREKHWKARLAEISVRERSGELVTRVDHERAMVALGEIVVRQMQAGSDRLANRDARRLFKQNCNDTRRAIARELRTRAIDGNGQQRSGAKGCAHGENGKAFKRKGSRCENAKAAAGRNVRPAGPDTSGTRPRSRARNAAPRARGPA